MFGWRARVGLICPSTNTVNESEWHPVLPEGVSLHSGVMVLEKTDIEGLQELNQGEEGYKKAARKLRMKELDVITYGGTSASMLETDLGAGIEANLEDIAGCPGVATSAAVRRALRTLGVQSVAVATPYIDEVNDRVERYLDAAGFTVTDLHGLGDLIPTDIGKRQPQTAYKQVKNDLDHSEADAVFISCTDYRTFDIIEPLEHDLNKPVVTSNQATLWNTLEAAGVSTSNVELGSLFDHDL